MKPIKWTQEKVIQLSSLYKGPSEFKKANPSAYKAMRRYKLNEVLYPLKDRERNQMFTKETLLQLMKDCTSRTDFQVKHPSAYNAARKLGIVELGFPIQKNAKKWYETTLALEAKKHKTRSDFYNNSPGPYSVAVKKGLIEQICPPAVQGTSSAEKEILTWLQTEINPTFITKRFKNDYELDCYSESLKLGIEYNGMYWHSEAKVGVKYHINKTNYFKELGIRVIHIWEYEWANRQEQVKDFIRSACGANQIRIGARKCDFEEIDFRTAKDFLNKTHIQGGPNKSSYSIGCYYQSELIGVCTFGSHHRNNSDIVLNRFACKANHTVSGFLAKSSKMAAAKFGVIYSWADYCKSNAKGYIASGWRVLEYSKPDYFYSDESRRYISKQSRKKNSVNTPVDMTEREHAVKDGLIRIWDCGKIKLIYS